MTSHPTVETQGERLIAIERHFAAPPEAVLCAHTDPELLQPWLLGPEGWTMPVCIHDARPGGKIRYAWSNGKAGGFHLTSEILEIDPPHRSRWGGAR